MEKYTGNARNVIIPEGVTSIASDAFRNNKDLSSLVIPEGVKVINKSAFFDHKDLVSVSFPRSLKFVENLAFDGTKLVEDYPDDMVIVDDILLKYKGDSSNVKIPNNVRVIASAAFDWNEAVKSITVPDNVEYIGKYAFLGCDNLIQVIFPNDMFIDVPLFTDPYLNIRARSLTTIKGTIYGDFIDVKGLARKFDSAMENIWLLFDLEAKVALEVKYPVIIGTYKADPDEDMELYISKNIAKIMPYAIERVDVDFVRLVIEKGMITKKTIAKFITAAENQPEIKALLEEYKAKL